MRDIIYAEREINDMIVFYDNVQQYREDRMPRACFGHGDRTCYALTDRSIERLNKHFNVNLWSEEGATYNEFADGSVILMKMRYNYNAEEFQEEEVKVLTKDEIAEIGLREKYE